MGAGGREGVAAPKGGCDRDWIRMLVKIVKCLLLLLGHVLLVYCSGMSAQNRIIIMKNALPKTSDFIFNPNVDTVRKCFAKQRKRVAGKLQNPRIKQITFKHFATGKLRWNIIAPKTSYTLNGCSGIDNSRIRKYTCIQSTSKATNTM